MATFFYIKKILILYQLVLKFKIHHYLATVQTFKMFVLVQLAFHYDADECKNFLWQKIQVLYNRMWG
jgi:hypothetical protein